MCVAKLRSDITVELLKFEIWYSFWIKLPVLGSLPENRQGFWVGSNICVIWPETGDGFTQ